MPDPAPFQPTPPDSVKLEGFVGVHFLRKRKSALLFGVGEDAALVAEQIAESSAG